MKMTGLKRFVAAIFISAFFIQIFCFTSFASTEVEVREGVCSISYKSDAIFGPIDPAVKFKFPKGHGDMHITIGGIYSLATCTDPTMAVNAPPISSIIAMALDNASSELSPGLCSNIYHLDFYDWSGEKVWSEILPNGGAQEYYVGPNVDYIGIWSWYENRYGAGQRPIIQGEVYYENVRND